MQNKKVLGITGGVGSGKSRILDILKNDYHAEVIQADEAAHFLMEPGQQGYEQVAEAFGPSVLKADGMLDRDMLSGLIFGDAVARQRMDGIIHPLVWQWIEAKINASQSELIVVEFAIMDFPHRKLYDEIWYIYAPEEVRAERLAVGRGYSKEKTDGIMDSQMTEEAYRLFCDRVIDNQGDLEETKAWLAAAWESIGK